MTRKGYFEELNNIRLFIKDMGDKTSASVRTAVKSFVDLDAEAAAYSRQWEKEIDSMYRQVDDKCIVTIATQQPAATDLRFLVASLKVASEVERVADYANNIAKIVQKKFPNLDLKPLAQLREDVTAMGDIAADMLADAIKAYETGDADLASSVIQRDKVVNKLNKSLFRNLVDLAAREPGVQEAVLEYHTGIRYIERVADRSTNIAEWALYIITGFHFHK